MMLSLAPDMTVVTGFTSLVTLEEEVVGATVANVDWLSTLSLATDAAGASTSDCVTVCSKIHL